MLDVLLLRISDTGLEDLCMDGLTEGIDFMSKLVSSSLSSLKFLELSRNAN